MLNKKSLIARGGSFCSFISYEYKTLFNNVTEIYIGLYGIITLPSGQGSAEGLRLFFCCCIIVRYIIFLK